MARKEWDMSHPQTATLTDTSHLSYLETVPVPASDGTESIPGLSASGQPTVETSAVSREMSRDGDFATLFGSVGKVRLRWTRSQVAKFAIKNPSKLRGGGFGNFFELDDGSVAHVLVDAVGRPRAYVYSFSGDYVW